jgi:SAM-dependent methyltransferase
MDVNYWNAFALQYDEMVVDPFTHGRSSLLARQIDKYASLDLEAADFGCGPGKLLPFLAERFERVYGYDFSEKLLEVAKQRCKGLKNVKLAQADLSHPVDHLPMIDVAVSLNAAIMPATDLRLNFLRGMATRIKPDGHLILNVPSVESLLYVAFRETEWYRRQGDAPRKAEFKTDLSSITRPRRLAQGVFMRGAEPTKHYLREELVVLIRDEMKLEPIEIMKMEYDWQIEFEVDDIPEWMREPFPWDWLVIARKNAP